MIAPRLAWTLTGGPLEDAARAIYDRLPMSKTLLEGNGYWFGVKFDVRSPIVRAGVGIGEFGVRR